MSELNIEEFNKLVEFIKLMISINDINVIKNATDDIISSYSENLSIDNVFLKKFEKKKYNIPPITMEIKKDNTFVYQIFITKNICDLIELQFLFINCKNSSSLIQKAIKNSKLYFERVLKYEGEDKYINKVKTELNNEIEPGQKIIDVIFPEGEVYNLEGIPRNISSINRQIEEHEEKIKKQKKQTKKPMNLLRKTRKIVNKFSKKLFSKKLFSKKLYSKKLYSKKLFSKKLFSKKNKSKNI